MKLYGVTGYPWQVLAPLMVVDDESVIVYKHEGWLMTSYWLRRGTPT